jgi:hypothetical protein
MSYLVEKYDYSLFESRFRDYGRQEQFSQEGLRALFDYLEELAQGLGEPIEVDVIALCCEWNEDSLDNVLRWYDLEHLEDLQDHTSAVELGNGTVLYQYF